MTATVRARRAPRNGQVTPFRPPRPTHQDGFSLLRAVPPGTFVGGPTCYPPPARRTSMRTGRYALVSLGTALVAAGLVALAGPLPRSKDEGDAVRPELIARARYNMSPPHFAKDRSVKIDYDIVYVRAPLGKFVWPDVGAPTLMEPGADLMLL